MGSLHGSVGMWLAPVAIAAWLGVACGDGAGTPPLGGSAVASGPVEGPPLPIAPEALKPVTLVGNAVAVGADDRTLIVADEDHEVLYRVPLAVDSADGVVVLPMPGPPAQVVDAGDAVFVTIRTLPTAEAIAARDIIKGPLPTRESMSSMVMVAPKPSPSAGAPAPPSRSAAPKTSAMSSAKPAASASPAASGAAVKPAPKKDRGTKPLMFDPMVVSRSSGGLLLVLKRDAQGALSESARLTLPVDAWGIALTPDTKRAVVTSAWAAKVSILDVGNREKPTIVATLDTAREPRGVAIKADGKTAYISHVVGSAITRVDGVDATPRVVAVEAPTAPSRTPVGAKSQAALGYSVLVSADQRTLYLPRHAIGADGIGSWWGAPVVDTLSLPDEKPLSPKRQPQSPVHLVDGGSLSPPMPWGATGGQPPVPNERMVQPRAAVLQQTKNRLFVASEGYDTIVELDARVPDPSMAMIRILSIGGDYDTYGHFAKHGGAPTGLALGRDESVLYVYCRSTFDVVRVELADASMRRVRVAEDGLPTDAAYGRRLYYNASSTRLSGGLGCAACHPDGRDDGYVWRETKGTKDPLSKRFVGSKALLHNAAIEDDQVYARQTPIIAGRTRANGPYAWHGEDADMLDRLSSGFALHRADWDWAGDVRDAGPDVAKVDYLADFLRSGLLPPPVLAREPTALEKQGKAIFESVKAACATCHVPERELSDRATHSLAWLRGDPEFAEEGSQPFRTPSLWFLSGSAPYFHDGAAATLEDLVEKNGTRMGSTAHLSADEKLALVAYLRTL